MNAFNCNIIVAFSRRGRQLCSELTRNILAVNHNLLPSYMHQALNDRIITSLNLSCNAVSYTTTGYSQLYSISYSKTEYSFLKMVAFYRNVLGVLCKKQNHPYNCIKCIHLHTLYIRYLYTLKENITKGWIKSVAMLAKIKWLWRRSLL